MIVPIYYIDSDKVNIIWSQTIDDCDDADGAFVLKNDDTIFCGQLLPKYECSQCQRKEDYLISINPSYEHGTTLCLDCLKELVNKATKIINELKILAKQQKEDNNE